MMESRNKNLESGGTSYPTYLDPWAPIFCISSHWKPATSVKMNGYPDKINRLLVWIFSIDWYLNWPYSNFITWAIVHKWVLGGVHTDVLILIGTYFYVFWVKLTLKKTIPTLKKSTLPYRGMRVRIHFTMSPCFWQVVYKIE